MTELQARGSSPPQSPAPERPWSWCLGWWPVWRRNVLVWRKLAIGSLLGNFGEPLLYLLALGYGLGSMLGTVSGLPYLHFLASGIVCSSAMMTASFEGTYSAYSRMAVQQTWDAIITAPLSVGDVVSGEIIWAASKAVLSAACILMVAAALGVVEGPRALLALPVVLIAALTFSSLALMVTAVSRSYEFFLFYFTLFVTPLLLLSGVFFPLDHMPAAVKVVSLATPLGHAVALVRPLVVGLPVEQAPLHLAVLVFYAVIAWSAAIWLTRRRMTR